MKDLRCLVGLHDFSEPPATTDAHDEIPGLKLECARCKKPKVVRYDIPPITGTEPYSGF